MRIVYEPRGANGFTCDLFGDPEPRVTVTRREDSVTVEVGPESMPTQAVTGAIERYADHEFASRRTRDGKRRRYHEREAKKWRAAAEDVADLLRELGDETESGWCSDCLTKSTHRMATSKTKFGTRRYICEECGSPTGICDVPRCRNFADRGGAPKDRSRFCAEHGHEIPSFEKLEDKVDSLDEYVPWLEFERFNAKRLSTIAAASVAGVAVVGPLAFVAAPAIGGAVGASAGLSGAAATSHGLALLGGGSLAAGGYGMAGGAAVIAAAGSGLGGASGASVANAYVGSDKSFGFEQLAEGDGPIVIVANGFLSEGQTGWGEWHRIISARYPDSPVHRVTWGAKELKSLGTVLAPGGVQVSVRALRGLAARATKNLAKIGPLSAAFSAVGLAKNPWHVARTRASMTGAVLADAIVRADLRDVVLVGFSLGGRVMAEAAEALATRDEEPRILEMHLLGAAVGTRRDFHAMESAVSGTIYNYFSTNDKVLGYLYTAAEAGSKAIGQKGIDKAPKNVKNVNVSRQVKAHDDHLRLVDLK